VILRVLAEAENEIESARRYLNEQSAGLGGIFLSDLEGAFAKIVEQPMRFGKLETLPDSPYRRALLKQFPYAIVFEVLSDEILVVAVAHSSRAPNYWLGRHRPP
jgi:toxin ParE1/3/4